MAAHNPVLLGHQVEIVRARRGISRSKLAKLLGLDRSTVVKWATVGASPRDPRAVAKALGVNLAEIFSARGKVKPLKRGRPARAA